MSSPLRILNRAAIVVATVLAIAGCSTLPTEPGAPSRSGSAPSMLNASDAAPRLLKNTLTNTASKAVSLFASKDIDGRVGGVVSVGRWKLVVPAGAYSGVGTVSISVPDTTLDKCDLGIAPLSLNHFQEDVELRFLCSSMREANARDMRWWDPANQNWVVIKSWPNDSDVSRCAPLKHFSTYMSGGKAGW